MRPSLSLALAATLLCGSSALAQVAPGEMIATVIDGTATPPLGQIWHIDADGNPTNLTLSTPVEANSVLMTTPATGYVGTNTAPVEIFRIVVAGKNATATPIFKNRTVLTNQANIAQIGMIGSDLYFVTNDAVTTNDATVWKVASAGGQDPVQVFDLSTLSAYPASGLANALATDGKSKVWVGVWTGGQIFEIDVSTSTPTAKLLMQLPNTKGTTATGVFYPANIHYRGGNLECYGLYGDVVVVDPATQKVLNHWWSPAPTGTGFSPYINSGYYNADQGHYQFGSRDGAVECLVPVGDGQLAHRAIEGVGSNATASSNSVTGLHYQAAMGNSSYVAYGGGCPGSGGYYATSWGRGLPQLNNPNWDFALHGTLQGTNAAILLIGATKAQIPLAGLGLPAGCDLRTLPLIVLVAPTTNASANGFGSAAISVGLPPSPVVIQTQWLVWDATKSQFDAVSDARELTTKK